MEGLVVTVSAIRGGVKAWIDFSQANNNNKMPNMARDDGT
jgi:hypothetical protein